MIDTQAVEQADIDLGRKLASQKENPWVKGLVKFGDLGDQEPLYADAAVIILIALLTWNPRRARLGVSMLLAIAAADLVKRIAKKLVKRTRPHVLIDEGEYQSDAGGSPRKPEQSFPSGHVACTVAAARAVSRHYPGAAPWAAATTGAIALARIAKGAHWPLDVAAGFLLGLLAEACSGSLLRILGVPRRPPPPSRFRVRHS